MSLVDKIMAIYPQLKAEDFYPPQGTISIVNDSDGRGDYIARWEHPDYPRPTDEQLATVEAK